MRVLLALAALCAGVSATSQEPAVHEVARAAADTPGRALRAGKCCNRAAKLKRKQIVFRQKWRECEASAAPTESELAAECIRNAHWEGTQAWTEGKWTVLNKQQFSHDWSFTYKARDGSNAKVDLEAWEESLRGLLTDVPPDDFYWNVKLHVPDDGFEIFDELIEVPYRVSPVARVPAGAVLRHGGRAFRVGDATEVVLPSEYINARVDRRTYRWVAAERVAVEARTDGRSVNTGGEALPVGIPIACGIDVSEAGPARSNENYFGGL